MQSTRGWARYARTGAVAFGICGVVTAGVGVANAAIAAPASLAAAPPALASAQPAGPVPVVSAASSTMRYGVTSAMRRTTATTIRLDRTRVATGGSVHIVGSTMYGVSKARVKRQTLHLQVKVNGAWKTIGSRRSTADGYVRYTVTARSSASYRLLYIGQGSLATSASPARTVTVTAATVPAATVTAASGGVSGKAATVLAVAAAQTGKWYRFGAAGPDYFDCSGLTQYVFKKVGIWLPHKANSQLSYGRAVSRSSARAGDLVFFLDGGYAYHVGIYAGNGYMYDAPYAGKQVGKRKIWGTNIVFRRLV